MLKKFACSTAFEKDSKKVLRSCILSGSYTWGEPLIDLSFGADGMLW